MQDTRPWLKCPSWNADLGRQVFGGDTWECPSCGESGTRCQKPTGRWGARDMDSPGVDLTGVADGQIGDFRHGHGVTQER